MGSVGKIAGSVAKAALAGAGKTSKGAGKAAAKPSAKGLHASKDGIDPSLMSRIQKNYQNLLQMNC